MTPLLNAQQAPRSIAALPSRALQYCLVFFQSQLRLKKSPLQAVSSLDSVPEMVCSGGAIGARLKKERHLCRPHAFPVPASWLWKSDNRIFISREGRRERDHQLWACLAPQQLLLGPRVCPGHPVLRVASLLPPVEVGSCPPGLSGFPSYLGHS